MKALTTMNLIVATLVQVSLSGPLPISPPISKEPSNVDEMVEYFINNCKLTYDYRTPAINDELDKMFNYIGKAKAKVSGDGGENAVKYQKLQSVLEQFQARIKKFNNKCGINDVLMILAPGVIREIIHTDDKELIDLSHSFGDLIKMNEVDRQVLAVKKMDDFMDGQDDAATVQFHTKYVKWDQENCFGVSVWEE